MALLGENKGTMAGATALRVGPGQLNYGAAVARFWGVRTAMVNWYANNEGLSNLDQHQ